MSGECKNCFYESEEIHLCLICDAEICNSCFDDKTQSCSSCMNQESEDDFTSRIKEYIRENLKIETTCEENSGYYHNYHKVIVTLKLEGEIISTCEDSFSTPRD